MDLSLAVASLMNNKDAPSEFNTIISQFISTLEFSPLELSAFSEDEENFSKFVQCLLLPPCRRPFTQIPPVKKDSPKRRLLLDNNNIEEKKPKSNNSLSNDDACARLCINCLTNMALKSPDLRRIIAASVDFDILTRHMLSSFFNQLNKESKSKSSSFSSLQSNIFDYTSINTTKSKNSIVSESSSKEKSEISNPNSNSNSSSSSTPNSKNPLSEKSSTIKSNIAVCSKSSYNFDVLGKILLFMKFASSVLSSDNVKPMSAETIHSIITASLAAIDIRSSELQEKLLTEKYNPLPKKPMKKHVEDQEEKNSSLVESNSPSCIAWSVTALTSLSRNASSAASIIVARPEYPSLRVKLALLLGSNNSSEVVSSISALVTLFPNTISYLQSPDASPTKENKEDGEKNKSSQISPRTAVEIALMAFKCDAFEDKFPIAYRLASWIIADISNFPKPSEIELELSIHEDDKEDESMESVILATLTQNEINDLLLVAQNGRVRAFEIFNFLSESSEQLHNQAQIVLSSRHCLQLFNVIRYATSSDDSFVTVAACNFLNIIYPFGGNSLDVDYEPKPKLKSRISSNRNNDRELVYSNASKAFIGCLNTLLVGCIHYKSKTPSLASVSTSNVNNSTPVPNISNLLKREAAASMLGFLCQIQGAATFAVSSLQRCQSRLFLDFERQIEANNSFLAVSYFLFLYFASTFFVDWRQRLSHIVISTQFTALLSHVLTEAQNRVAISKALQALIISSRIDHFSIQQIDNKLKIRMIRNKPPLLSRMVSNTEEIEATESSEMNSSFYYDSLTESPLFNSIVEGFLVANSAKKTEKDAILTEYNELKQRNELDMDEMRVEYELTNEELSNEVNHLHKKLEESQEISDAADALNSQKINKLEAEIRKLKASNKKLEETITALTESHRFRPSSRLLQNDISQSASSQKSRSKAQQQNPNQNLQLTRKSTSNDINNENSDEQKTSVNPFSFTTQLRLKEQEKLEFELKKSQGEITQLRETTLRESKASSNLRGLLEKSRKENLQLKNKLASLEKKCSLQETQLFRLKLDNDQLHKNISEKDELNTKIKKKITQIEQQKQKEISQLEKDKSILLSNSLASSGANSPKKSSSNNNNNKELIAKIEKLESQINEYKMLFKLIHKTTDKETTINPSITEFMNTKYVQYEDEKPK